MENINIIGYSLDAVLEAIRISTDPANGDKQVTLLATATLGSPLDSYDDLISDRYATVIQEMLGGMVEWTEYMNPRFYYVPFEKLKIANKNNGVMQYPFSKKSFADENEWKEICDAFSSPAIKDIVANSTLSPSKLITALKNNMPAKFNDSFIKAIPVTRWRGMQLSSFTMHGFNYEFTFNHLFDEDYNEYYCKPNISYKQICEMLLERFGIKHHSITAKEASELILSRNNTDELIVMDNRVDQYMNYTAGRFDRVNIWSVPINVPTQLMYSGDGLYYTPMSECWGVTIFDGKATRLMSKLTTTLFDSGISEIPSSKSNIKMYDQYANLITHYGNKKILLGQMIETLIK